VSSRVESSQVEFEPYPYSYMDYEGGDH